MNWTTFRKHLNVIFDDNTTFKGKYIDYFIQLLIFISLLGFAIETLPNNPKWLVITLYRVELFCVIIFTIEYILRVLAAKKPLKYVLSFYGVIDLIAILPFFLSRITDLRFVRAFRVFRVFRALKFIRFNAALRRFEIAFRIIKEELILFLLAAGIMIFVTGAGIYYFEHAAQPENFKSLFHSLWWSIVTLTTVGYGDVYPITTGGKIFTFFVLIIGVGIITVPAGLVATALSKARDIEHAEKAEALEVKQS